MFSDKKIVLLFGVVGFLLFSSMANASMSVDWCKSADVSQYSAPAVYGEYVYDIWSSGNSSTGQYDTIVKLDSDGNVVWEYQLSISGASFGGGERISSLVIDREGNVYGTYHWGAISLDSDGNLRWTEGLSGSSYLISSVSATGAYYDGIFYVNTGTLYALDSDSGDVEWSYNGDYVGDYFSAPVIDTTRGVIYAGDGPGGSFSQAEYYSLDLDGSLRWRVKSGSMFDLKFNEIYGDSAIGSDGTYYFSTSYDSVDDAGVLYAYYPNGTKKWQYEDDYYNDLLRQAPIVGEVGGCVYMHWQGLHCVEDGSSVWSYMEVGGYRKPPALGLDGECSSGFDDMLITEGDSLSYYCSDTGDINAFSSISLSINANGPTTIAPGGSIYVHTSSGLCKVESTSIDGPRNLNDGQYWSMYQHDWRNTGSTATIEPVEEEFGLFDWLNYPYGFLLSPFTLFLIYVISAISIATVLGYYINGLIASVMALVVTLIFTIKVWIPPWMGVMIMILILGALIYLREYFFEGV